MSFDHHCRWCGDGEHGKPSLTGFESLGFSASRSGLVALVAVCAGLEVGVDIEAVDPAFNWAAIAPIAFARGERVMGVPPKVATTMWCRKEAAVKAMGLGIVAELTSVRVDGQPDSRGWRSVATVAHAKSLIVRDLDVQTGYAAATAIYGCQSIPEIQHLLVDDRYGEPSQALCLPDRGVCTEPASTQGGQ